MNPFTNIQRFIDALTSDVTNLFLSLAVLGFILCAVMIFRGSEENVPRFQKGAFWTAMSVVVIVLAKIIVGYIKAGVA